MTWAGYAYSTPFLTQHAARPGAPYILIPCTPPVIALILPDYFGTIQVSGAKRGTPFHAPPNACRVGLSPPYTSLVLNDGRRWGAGSVPQHRSGTVRTSTPGRRNRPRCCREGACVTSELDRAYNLIEEIERPLGRSARKGASALTWKGWSYTSSSGTISRTIGAVAGVTALRKIGLVCQRACRKSSSLRPQLSTS